MPEFRERHGGAHGTPTVSLDALPIDGFDEHVKVEGRWRQPIRRPIFTQPTNPALETAMRPFLDDLTIPQRDALRLVYWERLSTRDAAERLGIAQPTLRERLTGAETKLRKAFEAAGLGTDYRDVRQGLTPSEDLAKFHTARCVSCGTPVAQYRPNALGLLPALLCPDHGTAR